MDMSIKELMEHRMAVPCWKVDNLNIWMWIFYLDYQDIFSFAKPVFKKDKHYEVYRPQLQLWRECTDLAKEKQGIFIYLSLPDDDETKIKERALDELSASELKKENGLDKLIEFFDKHFKKDDLEEEWAKYNDFDDFSRDDGLSMEDFVSKFDSLYDKLVKCEIKIPPQILAFRLLKKANLTKDECLLVMSGLDYSDKSRLYDQAKTSLKKFKGDGAVGVTCGGKDSDILVAQGGRYVPPMFRGNSRPFQSGLGRGRGYSRTFAVNRPGSDGKPMRCRGCESIGHLIRDCPHVGSRPQAHFADVDDNTDFYEETIRLFSVEESCQFLQRHQILLCWIQGVLLLSVEMNGLRCIHHRCLRNKGMRSGWILQTRYSSSVLGESAIRGCVYDSWGSCWSSSSYQYWCGEVRHTYAPFTASYEEGRRQDRHIKWFSRNFWHYSSVEYNNQWPLLSSSSRNRLWCVCSWSWCERLREEGFTS